MMERPYPGDYDCLWIAADRDGHIGAFITAGIAPIPVQVLDNEHMEVPEIWDLLYAVLARVSGSRLLVKVPRPDDLIALTERGLFVYDWTDVHRIAIKEIHAYEMLGAPLNPITVDMLPDEVASLLEGLKLDQVAFADAPILDIRAHRICRAEGYIK